MRAIIVFFLLLSFTAAATAVAIESPESSIVDEEEEPSREKLQGVADTFIEAFGGSDKVMDCVGTLLQKLNDAGDDSAINALKELASLDFSSDQLLAYGALLQQAVPLILESATIREDQALNDAIGNAVELLRDKQYLMASNAVFKALGYVEPGSEQHTLLKSVLECYKPMVGGSDLLKMIDARIAMFNQKQSQDEAL